MSALVSCESPMNEKLEIKKQTTEELVSFDTNKWSEKQGKDYVHRTKMVDNILYNEEIRALKKKQLLDLLGQPDYKNDNYFYYRIKETRILSWVLHTRTLVVLFDDNNSIKWIKMHE